MSHLDSILLSESEKVSMSSAFWAYSRGKYGYNRSRKAETLSLGHCCALMYVYSFGSDGVRQVDAVSHLKIDASNVMKRQKVIALLVERGLISRFTVSGYIRLFVSTSGAVYAQKLLRELKTFE